jgi:hypothetical protein
MFDRANRALTAAGAIETGCRRHLPALPGLYTFRIKLIMWSGCRLVRAEVSGPKIVGLQIPKLFLRQAEAIVPVRRLGLQKLDWTARFTQRSPHKKRSAQVIMTPPHDLEVNGHG